MLTKKFNRALSEAKMLVAQVPGIMNIILDDWRGERLIFDTQELRSCTNNCQGCNLFKLLNKKSAQFKYARLYQADLRDQRLFGPANFLNCKTIKEYQNCYERFILEKTYTEEDIYAELSLLFKMRVVYTVSGDCSSVERSFKKAVLAAVLKKIDISRKRIIEKYILENDLQSFV